MITIEQRNKIRDIIRETVQTDSQYHGLEFDTVDDAVNEIISMLEPESQIEPLKGEYPGT